MLVRLPGVYTPVADSLLLRKALIDASVPRGARALDICTGTGIIALAAAELGASYVRALDLSHRAVFAARCNARLRRLPIHVRRGDFRTQLGQERFDIVTANPPYVPCPDGDASTTGNARAWNAGHDGRLYLDPLCAMAPRLLNPGGIMLIVHSSLCQPDVTVQMLAEAGLKASVVARRGKPFGPVVSSRAAWLEDQGLIAAGQRREELVVIRADHVTSASPDDEQELGS